MEQIKDFNGFLNEMVAPWWHHFNTLVENGASQKEAAQSAADKYPNAKNDFSRFLNEDNYGDDMKERGKLRDSYKKDKMIKSAIKFAIEKYTNNAEAMAHQEAEKTFDEWTKSKSKEYRSYESLEESNEERGYIEYEYDSKTKKIKRTGKSGVCSEYGIGWDVTFDQPRKYIKDLLDAGKPIRFYEYPSSPEKEIEQGINDFIAKIK